MSKPYAILSIYEGHMASAAIMVDGVIVAATHEERFTRTKMDVGFPVQAALYCLESADISPAQIDRVMLINKTVNVINQVTKRAAKYSVGDYIDENEKYWHPRLLEGNNDLHYFDAMGWDKIRNDHNYDIDGFDFRMSPKQQAAEFNKIRLACIEKYLGIPEDKVTLVDHYKTHHYHAFYSYAGRNYDTLIMHNEASGGMYNAAISKPTESGIKFIAANNETDLGRIYKWITLIMGMKPYHHEYKMMGLAPYSNEYEADKAYKVFERLFETDPDSLLIQYKNRPTDLYFHFRKELMKSRFDGIAGAVQKLVERQLVDWFKTVTSKLPCDQICYAGGVAMNVKANKDIAAIDDIRQLFVPVSPADETTVIGGCYIAEEERLIAAGIDPVENIAPLENVYLGRSYTDGELQQAIKDYDVRNKYYVYEGVGHEQVADLLAAGHVVARCSGRSELGQRALGNRSILANPSMEGVIDKINHQIKYRDFWMPFCPSMLADRANELIINDKGISSKFMTMSFDSRDDEWKRMQGVVHPSDKTVRPQLVERNDNPDYYDLINAFAQKTGLPTILNTSFNLHGEPNVDTPADAFHTFENSELDMVWLGDTLVSRRPIDA